MKVGPDPSTTSSSPQRLLLLFPGPVHDLEEHFSQRLQLLSRSYSGMVIVAGPQHRIVTMGRFTVVLLAEGRGLKAGEFATFLRVIVQAVRAARREGKPFDAVVTYDPLKTGLLGWVAARLGRMPLIVEVNGDYTARENYADIRASLRGVTRQAYLRLERFVLRRARGIKLLYEGQIDFFRRSVRDPVLRVFPNFVDLSGFHDLGEHPEVLIAGFPYYLKGVDLLIDAFKSVSSEFPEWRLKILGWFPNQSEMQAAIGGHPRIDVHPPVYRREMPEHMGRCGIFVLPSRTEAMGRVLLEAMACAKPRIGSAVGGIPLVINDGVDGILIQPNNVPDLTSALRRLMADPELRRRLGRAGEERVRNEFSASAYFGRLQEFYRATMRAH